MLKESAVKNTVSRYDILLQTFRSDRLSLPFKYDVIF